MILNVSATGEEPKYTRIYLDSLLDEYIAFRKELIDHSVSDNMNKIIIEVLTREKQVKQSAAAMEEFASLNDPALLSTEHERLVKEVSTLRSELEALMRSSTDESKIKVFKERLAEIEKAREEVWSKESKHQELKKKYEDTERDYADWKKTLARSEGVYTDRGDMVNIMERPTAAVLDEPELWLSLYLAGLAGAAAGVLVMFIAAFALTRLSKYPEASPPPLN